MGVFNNIMKHNNFMKCPRAYQPIIFLIESYQ